MLLTLAHHSSVFIVAAVVDAQSRVVALRQSQLVPKAVHLIVENGFVKLSNTQLRIVQVQQGSDET